MIFHLYASVVFIAFTLIAVGELQAAPAVSPANPSASEDVNKQHRIIFHDDSQSLLETPAEGAEEFLRIWIGREMDMFPTTTFCYLTAFPDICFHDTKVGEVYGDRFGKGELKKPMWKDGIDALRANGTDVLKIAIDEARQRGIEILAAIRMGDTHYRSLDPKNPLVPQFVIDHPQYVIKQPDGRTNETALDYSHPEVREHRLAIMREIAENYDVDGLELNFVRWAKFFPNDKGREKAHIMTAFVGQVRDMLDAAAARRGRGRLTLGVVVPENIEACWLAGCDPETWVKRGWIDYLTIGTWNETDPGLPVDKFSQFTKGTPCQLLVNMGNMMGGNWQGLPDVKGRGTAHFRRGYYGMLLTPPETRACAANYYAWGADGVSLWNLSCSMGEGQGNAAKFGGEAHRQRVKEWTNAIRDMKSVMADPRLYHYLPLSKRHGALAKNYPFRGKNQSALGTMKAQIVEFSPETHGKRQVYHFRMADGRDGQPLKGHMRFWIYFHEKKSERLEIDINGQRLSSKKLHRTEAGEFRSGLPGVRFDIDLADCPPFKGNNELGMKLIYRSDMKEIPYMEELEVYVE